MCRILSVNASRWRFPPREASVSPDQNFVDSPGSEAAVGIAGPSSPEETAHITTNKYILHPHKIVRYLPKVI